MSDEVEWSGMGAGSCPDVGLKETPRQAISAVVLASLTQSCDWMCCFEVFNYAQSSVDHTTGCICDYHRQVDTCA
jgi:hypothetical protein